MQIQREQGVHKSVSKWLKQRKGVEKQKLRGSNKLNEKCLQYT